jgi:hypothetical protein
MRSFWSGSRIGFERGIIDWKKSMLTTGWKSKVHGHLSYPIGAEALSQAVPGFVPFESIWLGFGNSTWPAAGPQRLVADHSPKDILVAEFGPANDRGSVQEWFLHVYAVPRELRQKANHLLMSEGIPILSAWFEESRAGNWRSRSQGLWMKYLAADNLLIVDRTSGAGVAAQPLNRAERPQRPDGTERF